MKSKNCQKPKKKNFYTKNCCMTILKTINANYFFKES